MFWIVGISRLIAFLLGLNNIFRMLIILECFFPCLQTVLKLQIYESNGILKQEISLKKIFSGIQRRTYI